MSLTAARMSSDAGGGATGGFPAALFTIEDDPSAVRASGQSYLPMARQASATRDTLTGLGVPTWQGSEGDLFRTRRASYEPMMAAARRAFTALSAAVVAFADTLAGIKARMDELRAEAERVWAQLQAARTAAASAAANLTAAGVAMSTAPTNPVAAARAVTTLVDAQNAYGDASAALDGLQSRWDACVAAANKLHTELADAAATTAATIRGIEAPPAVPGQAAGGVTGTDMSSMTCQAIPDPGAQTADGQEPPEGQDEQDEPGFISSGKNFLGGLWNKSQSVNPLSTDAERQAASDQADKDFDQAGKDIRHAGDRIGNGLTGAGQVVGAGATKLTALAVSPFDKDLSSRFDKAANDAWTDGSRRLKKDGLYTLDVLSNALPGGIAKGAAVFGGKTLIGLGIKAGAAKLAAGTGTKMASSLFLAVRRPSIQIIKTEAEVKTWAQARKFWSHRIEHEGIRVYQRNDLIDPLRQDLKGRTSRELMERGRAPIGPDGRPIQLHHLLQTPDGPVAEIPGTMHSTQSRVIHIFAGEKGYRSQIHRPSFDAFRRSYWSTRSKDF